MERVQAYGTERLAEVFGVRPQTIRLWARRGTIPATKLGGAWYLGEAELRQVLRRRLEGRGDEPHAAGSREV